MAQKIFTPFGANVASFELREAYAGIIQPSVYRGFDSLTVLSEGGGSHTIQIHHNITGFLKVLPNNLFDSNPTGVLFMPNGMVVHDDDPVQLTLSTAEGLRIDAVIADILYIEEMDSPGAYFHYLVEEDVGFNYDPNNAQRLVIGYITWGYQSEDPGFQESLPSPDINLSIGYIRNYIPNLANKPDRELPNFDEFAKKPDNNIFTGNNTFNSDLRINKIISTPLRNVTSPISADGYIILGGQGLEGVEFRMDLDTITSNTDIFGFRYEGRNFSTGGVIRPGLTIKIRFFNTGSNKVTFKPVQGTGINRKGFFIPSHINIIEGVLYSIRLESIVSTANALFSISPQVGLEDFINHKEEVNDLIGAYKTSFGNVLISEDHCKIYYSYKEEVSSARCLVTINAHIRDDYEANSGNNLLPSHLRPSNIIKTNEQGAHSYLGVHPNGQVFVSNSGPDFALFTCTYLSGVDGV